MLGALPLRPDQAPRYPSGPGWRRRFGSFRQIRWGRLPAGSVGFGRLSLSGMLGTAGQAPGYETSPRLPEEARYLASLPAAKAIAVRLDARGLANEPGLGRRCGGWCRGRCVAAGGVADAAAGRAGAVTARWAWTPAAAVALPAFMLIIVAIVL